MVIYLNKQESEAEIYAYKEQVELQYEKSKTLQSKSELAKADKMYNKLMDMGSIYYKAYGERIDTLIR